MDCLATALAALHLIGVNLATVPAIVVEPSLARAGQYTPGVIHVRETRNCTVYMHELFHHKQYEIYKRMPTQHEYLGWEMDAATAAMYAEQAYEEKHGRLEWR